MLGGLGNSSKLDVAALAALRMGRLHRAALSDSLAKLASGSRFAGMGRGFGAPADLIASETLKATMAALDAETRINERALAQVSVADGAMGEVSGMLIEVKALSAANADGLLTDGEREANQIQIDSILASVDRLSGSTSFLGTRLLDGTAAISASGEKVQIASVHTSELGAVTIDGSDYSLKDLKSGGALTGEGEKSAKVVDAAISAVATSRGRIGAFAKHHVQSRLNSLGRAYEELSKANSLIADVDYAAEISRKVREELLSRAATFSLKSSDQSRRGYLLDLLG